MFDLAEFLTAMLKAFLECRQDPANANNDVTFRAMLDGQVRPVFRTLSKPYPS